MTDRELMQQALDALDSALSDNRPYIAACMEAHEALRARLAQPEQEIESDRSHIEDDGCPTEKAVLQRFWREHQMREPVAWMHNFIDEVVIAHRPADLDRHPDRWTPLYKDPTPCQTCKSLARTVMMDQTYHDSVMAQREWQGLTDEEILEEYRQSYGDDGNLTDIYFAHAIEAKLKDKNGY